MKQTHLFLFVSILCSLSSAGNDEIPRSSQVHIALIPPDKLSISWVTKEPYDDDPMVALSTKAPDQANNTNDWSQIGGYTQPDDDIHRYYHHVITPTLTPHQRYWYKPGYNASIYSFTARNLKTSTPSPTKHGHPHSNEVTRILAYGDLGVANSKETMQRIKAITNTTNADSASTAIDFILHFGDIAYADDYDEVFPPWNPRYAEIYDEWADSMESVMSAIPYMVSPGNHEQTCHSWSDFRCHSSLENFTVYRNYFRMPSAEHHEEGGGVMNMWWSMNYKNIHILTISTETDYPGSPDQGHYHNDFVNPEAGPFGDQMEFVRRDLKAAHENPNISWIIVNGHRPYYTSAHNWRHPDWPPQTPFLMRESFEHLFYEYNVDLYVSGHIHGYERLWPMHKEKVTTKDYLNPLSTVYFVAGMAGNKEGHEVDVPLKNYTAVWNNKDYGVSTMTIMNDTHLLWQFIGATQGKVLDEVWIKKGHWV